MGSFETAQMIFELAILKLRPRFRETFETMRARRTNVESSGEKGRKCGSPRLDCDHNLSRLLPQFVSKPSESITTRIGSMANRALDLMAKVSSRFVHEILPVATAGLVGAMLVNHYGRQPSSVVVQAQPSASEDAMVQSLREEHELIAGFMKRREEIVKGRQEMDAERSGGALQAA